MNTKHSGLRQGCKRAAVGRGVRKGGAQIEVSGISPVCVSRPWDSCVSLFVSGGARGVRVTIPRVSIAALMLCTF